MNDMSSVIVAKSDQINAEDLIGKTMTVTIEGVTIRGGQEQPVSIKLAGFDKVWRPCKTVCRILAKVWGLDAKQYVGKSVTLYHDPSVKYGGLLVGGIRISHVSHIDQDAEVVVQATRGAFKAIRVKPLILEPSQQAPQITIEEARKAIGSAVDLDALATVWRSRAMAPFREQLQAQLDARKVELSSGTPDPAYGRGDEDHGEQFSGGDDADVGGSEVDGDR